jgi:hypothetical protein
MKNQGSPCVALIILVVALVMWSSLMGGAWLFIESITKIHGGG